MARLFRRFVQYILKFLARIYLIRINPQIIVIAGTTNRHWVKEYIVDALNSKGLTCRGNKKNFNAEIGLPLSVLGLYPESEDDNIFLRWFRIIWQAVKISANPRIDSRKSAVLVLEMAIDRPDDMDYLLSIVRPQIAVFTTITMIYPENFENLDEIALEYRKLIKALPADGSAILNADDKRIYQLKDSTRCQIITYGIENKNADYLTERVERTSTGQKFDIHTPDFSVEKVRLNRFGQHHIYAKIVEEIIMQNIQNPISKTR